MSALKRLKRLWDFISVVLLTGVAYPLGRLIYRNKDIWLIGERPGQAQDNGYHLFKYLCTEHPERRVYYVIKKDSSHLDKVAQLGSVIRYGSLKHWIMYYGCAAEISTHIRGLLPTDNWRYQTWAAGYKQKKKKQVFLQHGVICADLPTLYREKAQVDLFICGAKPEYDFIKENFHYRDGEVKYTGLARYDALHDFSVKKQILIMPTWRMWLAEKDVDLPNSEYVRKWNEVITDQSMIDAAKRAGYQIVFYPHSEIQPMIDLFRSVDDAVIIARDTDYDVQTLLKESALLITDYSSVFFDFAYMRKPVLYFQFDFERFYTDHYAKGYFLYERDGFGKVADTVPALVENIVEEIDNGVVLSEKYSRRIDRFFPLYDQKNCERIYREIEEICP